MEQSAMFVKQRNLNNGIVDNVCGDIDDVKDGESQEQLVEGGDHLGLPEHVFCCESESVKV